ncbi:hypothetical protein [Methylobacterium sp.]|uniref:hypothetical protein n=1 Tax=Methylobacterium sp. TaxID=409 RepID=UPI003B015AE0
MTLVMRSTYIRSVQHVRMPVTLRAHNTDSPSVVSDGSRYRSIGSLQALGLAVVASFVTPALLWLVL